MDSSHDSILPNFHSTEMSVKFNALTAKHDLEYYVKSVVSIKKSVICHRINWIIWCRWTATSRLPAGALAAGPIRSPHVCEGTSASAILHHTAVLISPKHPSSEHHGATRQQAIVKTTAKWSAYHIPSVIVVFVVLVSKVQSVSLIPKSLKRPWTYQLQRTATEHSSTCHCIRLYTICWMYW
jgi:hypothetical protein